MGHYCHNVHLHSDCRHLPLSGGEVHPLLVLSGVFTGLGIFIVFLGTVAVLMLTQPTKTVGENVPRPASFTVQVEKEFDVRNLSCPPTVMSAKNALPDAGAYQCTITNGRDDSALKDVTLIVTADNKVGLYDNQGKEMK